MGYNCVICHRSVSVEEIEEEKAYTVTTEFGDIVGYIHTKCIDRDAFVIPLDKDKEIQQEIENDLKSCQINYFRK